MLAIDEAFAAARAARAVEPGRALAVEVVVGDFVAFVAVAVAAAAAAPTPAARKYLRGELLRP